MEPSLPPHVVGLSELVPIVGTAFTATVVVAAADVQPLTVVVAE